MINNFKAKYLGKHYSKYEKAMIGLYEYRGIQYEVKFGWNAEPASWQHRSNQDFIDRVMDAAPKTTSETVEHAQVGVDAIFNFFETGEWVD